MARFGPPRSRPPLDRQRLEELAIRYVGRYATSRAKLHAYLARKVRERGWSGEREPDLDALTQQLSDLGYVDDAAFALAKSRDLSIRGYGKRRLKDTLRLAGIAEEEGTEAFDHADIHAVEAALRLAQRRKIGPFATGVADPKQRQKAIAAMIRAGHSFALARTIVDWPRSAEVDLREIADRVKTNLS